MGSIDTARAAAVLADASVRAPAIARSLPDDAIRLVERGGGHLTSGIPRFTWDGLDAQGRLFPGVHPATAGEAQLRFAWNDRRAAMFDRMRTSLANLRSEHPHVRHVLGGGSYFSGKPHPGDIDVVLLADEPGLLALRTRNRREPVLHAYPAQPWLSGIPQRSFVDFFRHDRSGVERGLVLLDLDDLLGAQLR